MRCWCGMGSRVHFRPVGSAALGEPTGSTAGHTTVLEGAADGNDGGWARATTAASQVDLWRSLRRQCWLAQPSLAAAQPGSMLRSWQTTSSR